MFPSIPIVGQPGGLLPLARTDLTRGLVLAGYGNLGLRNVVGPDWTLIGSPLQAASEWGGAVWQFNGTSSALANTSPDMVTAINVGNCTMMCLMTPRGSLVAFQTAMGAGDAAANNSIVNLGTDISTASSAGVYWRGAGATATQVTIASQMALNRQAFLLLTATAGAIALYTKSAQGSAAASGDLPVVTRMGLGMDGRLAFDYGRTDLQLYAFWTRPVTVAEVQMLRANPWQIFASSQRRIYFDTPVAGGDVLFAQSVM